MAPEFQIATEYQNTLVTNSMFLQAFHFNSVNDALDEDAVFINIDEELTRRNRCLLVIQNPVQCFLNHGRILT